jgi:hypothetical protein
MTRTWGLAGGDKISAHECKKARRCGVSLMSGSPRFCNRVGNRERWSDKVAEHGMEAGRLSECASSYSLHYGHRTRETNHLPGLFDTPAPERPWVYLTVPVESPRLGCTLNHRPYTITPRP